MLSTTSATAAEVSAINISDESGDASKTVLKLYNPAIQLFY